MLFHHAPPPEPERHLPFFKLWDAFGPCACPICLLRARFRSQTIGTLFDEGVNDVGVRMRLHDALGFCDEASNEVEHTRDPQAISILYRSLCRDLAERLSERHPQLAPRDACPIRDAELREEARLCNEFALHYVAPDFQARHAESFGLCLGHLGQVLYELKAAPLREKLLAVEREKFAALAAQLDLYLDRTRYDNRVELGDEREAWKRALRKLRRPEP